RRQLRAKGTPGGKRGTSLLAPAPRTPGYSGCPGFKTAGILQRDRSFRFGREVMAASPRTPLHRQLDRLQHRLFLLGFGRGFILCVAGAPFRGASGLPPGSPGPLRPRASDPAPPALPARLGPAGVGLLLATIAAAGIAWWRRPSRLDVALQLDA